MTPLERAKAYAARCNEAGGMKVDDLVQIQEEAIQADRGRIAEMFKATAGLAELGEEDAHRGASVYNWAMWAAEKVRSLL